MKTKNVNYSDVLNTNKNYKEQSLFSVLNFLNKDAKTLEMCKELNFTIVVKNNKGVEVQKTGLDINRLKSLCPNYFKMTKKDKDGNLITVDRLLFAPFTFLKAIYKLYKAV